MGSVWRERGGVAIERLADHLLFGDVPPLTPKVLDRHDHRRVRREAKSAVCEAGGLRIGALRVAPLGLGDQTVDLEPLLVLEGCLQRRRQLLHIDPQVPDIHRRHLCQLEDGGPIEGSGRLHDLARVAVAEPVVLHGDDGRGAHPLHVPLEGTRQRLVKIVDVEDQPPIRSGKDAEVRDMGVAAELHLDLRVRGHGEVVGHHRRRPSQEGELRCRHPLVAKGQEILDAGDALRHEAIDRVEVAVPLTKLTERLAWQLLSARLALRDPLRRLRHENQIISHSRPPS